MAVSLKGEPECFSLMPGARASRPHKGWHERGYLPHFDSAATQTITFRLADSLPREAFEEAVAASADDFEQIAGFPLGEVVHSWKSFTAKAINKRQGSTGAVWAPDYFDRFIRDEAHYAVAIRYIEDNPIKAGLAHGAAEWPFSSARERAGGSPALP
jgi:putative transposase